jgi:hypothetical protein
MNAQLEAKLKTLPRSAGVYFHKSSTGEIIYVGVVWIIGLYALLYGSLLIAFSFRAKAELEK